MRKINCHIPIKLRITGSPSDAQLDQLGEELTRALVARLSFAKEIIEQKRASFESSVIEQARAINQIIGRMQGTTQRTGTTESDEPAEAPFTGAGFGGNAGRSSSQLNLNDTAIDGVDSEDLMQQRDNLQLVQKPEFELIEGDRSTNPFNDFDEITDSSIVLASTVYTSKDVTRISTTLLKLLLWIQQHARSAYGPKLQVEYRFLLEHLYYITRLLGFSIAQGPGLTEEQKVDSKILDTVKFGIDLAGLAYNLRIAGKIALQQGTDEGVPLVNTQEVVREGIEWTFAGMKEIRKDSHWAAKHPKKVTFVLGNAKTKYRKVKGRIGPVGRAAKLFTLAVTAFNAAQAAWLISLRGVPALSRAYNWLKGTGLNSATVGFQFNTGGTAVACRLVSTAGTLELTTTEVIALADVGVVSKAALDLYILAKGGHTTGARPSTKGKHEKAETRRETEQKAAQEQAKSTREKAIASAKNKALEKVRSAVKNLPNRSRKFYSDQQKDINLRIEALRTELSQQNSPIHLAKYLSDNDLTLKELIDYLIKHNLF